MSGNSNLNKAKQTQNNEFYTQMNDIAEELKHYRRHFNGATVFCNCDDPEWSNFWRYFHLNFEFLGLRKLISTHYDPEKPTYKMEYEGGNDEDTKVGVITPLVGNGDFRNRECLDLMDEADIICTNPPFSIAREEYLPTLFEHNKRFLIIGDLGWATYKEVFPLIKENRMWLGYNTVKEFRQPDNTMKKFGNKLWYTNLDIDKLHDTIPIWKKYNPIDYPKYVNYDAIEVSRINDIPIDYDGLMGVPVSFISKYNPEQFELVGTVSAASDPDTLNLGINFKDYIGYKQDGTKNGRNGATFGKCPVLEKDDKKHPYYEYNGVRLQATYPRVFIRRRETCK